MNFLSSLFSKLIAALAPVFFDWTLAGVKKWTEWRKARAEKKKQREAADAALDREAQAVTPEEQEDAFKDSISHSNKP